jgi:very-short-patch-repair endonuclease
VLAAYREPAFTRSELERRFLELVRQAGLPRPSVNFFIAGYEIDMYWPPERFGVELDGFEFHRTRAAFERDRRRQEDLKMAGIEIVRLTFRRIEREPGQVAQRLCVLLARRRAELAG